LSRARLAQTLLFRIRFARAFAHSIKTLQILKGTIVNHLK